ncbi:MAG: glycerophosphodiester phosphodiesterase [Mycobacteriales bacterium]
MHLHDHPAVRPPIGFAHRGGRSGLNLGWLRLGSRGGHAENTAPAFLHALRRGASALESDLWRTADGVAVLRHDGEVDGRRVRELTRAELPADSLSLPELYASCGTDFNLSLDVSDPAAFPAAIAAAEHAGAAGRIWLVGEWPIGCHWRASAGPDAHLVAGLSFRRLIGDFEGRLAAIRATGTCAVNMPDWQWSRSRVAAVHAAGLLGFGWRANTPWQIDRLAELGCDGIYSDSVSALQRATTPV